MNPVTEAIAVAVERKGRGAKAQLAQDVDVTMSTVTRWASGQILPSRVKWSAIERSLGMRAGTLEAAHMAGIKQRVGDASGPSVLLDELEKLGHEVQRLADRVHALELRLGPPNGLQSPASHAPVRSPR